MENTITKKIPINRRKQRSKNTDPPRLLIAEDDKEMRALLAQSLRNAGYMVDECPDGISLLKHLYAFILFEGQYENIDLIISDIRMPGISGMEVMESIYPRQNFPPMILITAFGDEITHAKAKHFGVAALFDKPFNIDKLIEKVREIVPMSG